MSSRRLDGAPMRGPGKIAHRREDVLLAALRRIIRAIDLHSKKLERETGLTTPQVLVLRAVRDLGEVTTARIAAQVTLSQATVSTIVERLEARGLIERYRNTVDRRIVHTRLTPAGATALARAPKLLDTVFLKALRQLPEPEQDHIIDALERVAGMMAPTDSESAPPWS